MSRSYQPLLVLLVLTLVVRLACVLLIQEAPVIEGSEYGRIAENICEGNGYKGLLPGPELMLPPLYPSAMAGVMWVTGKDSVFSGRLVSLLASLIIVAALYSICLKLWGTRAALLAGILASLAPLMVLSGVTMFSETLQAALLALALLWMLSALDGHALAALATGLTLGLAYLARVESLPLAMVVIIGMVITVGRRNSWGSSAQIGALALGGFLLGALPYALFVEKHTGEYAVAGKSARVFLTIERFAEGMDLPQANYGLSKDGAVEGPWLEPNKPFTGPSAGEILSRSTGSLVSNWFSNAVKVLGRLLIGKGPSSIVLLLLAFYALTRREGLHGDAPTLYTCLALGLTTLGIAAFYKVLVRYTIPLSIPLFIAAARGAQCLLERRISWSLGAIASISFILLLTISSGLFMGMGEFRESQEDPTPLCTAASSLLQDDDSPKVKRILCSDSRVPYFCREPWEWVPLPQTSDELALRSWAHRNDAQYLVVTQRDLEERLAPWFRLSEPPSWMTLLEHSAGNAYVAFRLYP